MALCIICLYFVICYITSKSEKYKQEVNELIESTIKLLKEQANNQANEKKYLPIINIRDRLIPTKERQGMQKIYAMFLYLYLKKLFVYFIYVILFQQKLKFGPKLYNTSLNLNHVLDLKFKKLMVKTFKFGVGLNLCHLENKKNIDK